MFFKRKFLAVVVVVVIFTVETSVAVRPIHPEKQGKVEKTFESESDLSKPEKLKLELGCPGVNLIKLFFILQRWRYCCY